MNSSSVSRRSALRTLALAVALVGSTTPAWNTAAFAAEPATYTLTINHLDRTGHKTADYTTHVTGVSGPGADEAVQPYDASGTTTVRLPKGRYLLDSALTTGTAANGTDWVVQPRLDHDTTITVDARTTAPVDVTPPDRSAGFRHSVMFVQVKHDGAVRTANLVNGTPNLRVDNAVFGPALTDRPGVVRDGDRLAVDVPLLADGDGHVPSSLSYDTASTTLHRNGVRVGTKTGTPERPGSPWSRGARRTGSPAR
ncbi:hypothetical protein [Streptomyces sp. NBC_00057]|uniref:hypothetical protein n=1 Tax=Streptomyces sp. NBC_00057 TaxID=2975634 RepID=UPI003248C37F